MNSKYLSIRILFSCAYVLFLSLFSIDCSYATNNCTSVDSRDGSMGRNRNQDGVGQCTAYALADLFSFKFKKRVSSMDLSATYWYLLSRYKRGKYKDFKSWFKRFGMHPSELTKEALNRGLCLDSDLPSLEYFLSDLEGYVHVYESLLKLIRSSVESIEVPEIDRQIDTLSQLTPRNNYDYHRIEMEKRRLEREKLRIQLEKFSKKSPSCFPDGTPWDRVLPNLGIEDVYRAIVSSLSEVDFFASLVKRNCDKKRFIPEKVSIEYLWLQNAADRKYGMDVIDKQLNKGNIVAVSFYSDFLTTGEHTAEGIHSINVVARRHNKSTGKCEYLLRNTWGEDCYGYFPEFECDSGNVWIPKEYVENSIYEYIYLE